MAPKREKTAAAAPPAPPTPRPPVVIAPPRWGVGRTLRWLFVMVAVAISIVALISSRSRDGRFKLERGVPTEASAGQLRGFATPRRPVYWAGPSQSGMLEVTRTAKAVYVRYLPKGVKLGDRAPNYLTIATYSVRNATANLRQAAQAPGAAQAKAPRGGIAVWRKSRPTSVYLAYPGVRYLIEVYDPSPRRARRLALGGKVTRVS